MLWFLKRILLGEDGSREGATVQFTDAAKSSSALFVSLFLLSN